MEIWDEQCNAGTNAFSFPRERHHRSVFAQRKQSPYGQNRIVRGGVIRYKPCGISLYQTSGFYKLAPFTTEESRHLIIISIMAGSHGEYQEYFPGARVVRTMPNLLYRLGRRIGWCLTKAEFSSTEYTFEKLFSVLLSVPLRDEGMLDALTAIVGSGPAYVFVRERAIRSAESLGFDKKTAERMCKTMQVRSPTPRLKENVISINSSKVQSKGGTTEAALKKLDVAHFTQSETSDSQAYRQAQVISSYESK